MSVTPIDLNGETTYVFDGNGTFLTQLTALTTAKIGSKAIGPGMSEYKYAADGWVQTSFGGAVGVSANWSSQTFPDDRYDQSTATAANATDNTVFGTVTDQDIYDGVIFMNTTADCTLQITLDGTNWIAADHPFIDMGVAARTVVTGTNTNTGPFLMNTPCKGFRFLNEGAAACTVTYAQVGKVGI